MSLLLDGGDVGDGSLINLSHRVGIGVVLHQPEVIKPGVIVVWVRLTRTSVMSVKRPQEVVLEGEPRGILLILEVQRDAFMSSTQEIP